MVIFIYVCILVLNIVAILLNYRFLGNEIEKKEKLIFTVVGIAIMYLTVSFIYWLSSRNLDLGTLADLGKNFMVFTFVPVNSILVLPFLASSYKKYKAGKIDTPVFKNRIILVAFILFVVLFIEFFYFQDIQTGILNIVSAKS